MRYNNINTPNYSGGPSGSLTPFLDQDPLNGVNSYDLVLISRHILGLEPLNTPYKLISADANRSGTITTFDIVEFRKLLLGTNSYLTNNDSWRFVEKTQSFPNPNNPFSTPLREKTNFSDLQNNIEGLNFIGIKIGDVDNTAEPNFTAEVEDRRAGCYHFEVEDAKVPVGEPFRVRVVGEGPIDAAEFWLNIRGAKVLGIESPNMPADHFVWQKGCDARGDVLHAVWNAPGSEAVRPELTLVLETKWGQASLSRMLSFGDYPGRQTCEAFDGPDPKSLAFQFLGELSHQEEELGEFMVDQNTPNPWSETTRIPFYLPKNEPVTLSIYDALGRLLFQQKSNFEAGEQAFELKSSALPETGVLYYRLETPTSQGVKSMLLLGNN